MSSPPLARTRALRGRAVKLLPAKVCATGGVGYHQDEEVYAVEMTETILQLESQNRPMRNRGNLQKLSVFEQQRADSCFDCSGARDFYDAQQMSIGYWRCMCIHVPLTCV